MRTVASEVESRGVRGQAGSGSRSATTRKVRLRRLALEGLEARTLLATIPAATVSAQVDVSNNPGGTGAQETSPSIAYDPNSPQDMVAVWTIDSANFTLNNGQTTIFAQVAYSTNAGSSW